MRVISPLYICGLVIFALAFLPACARKPSSTADVPRILPASYEISVAPFTQPLNAGQLITGNIPENQGKIPHDALAGLDRDLREVLLTGTKRQYNFIGRRNLPKDWTSARSSGQPSALGRWLAYAREHGARYLLIPQVLDWHEREGSEAGVTSSAHVRAEFYLLDVDAGLPRNRSIYEEKQVGLIDDLLSVGNFVKRKGQWVTAGALTREGMAQAVKDMGL